MEDINERAIEATKRYLTTRGYAVEGDWYDEHGTGVVAREEEELVFVGVSVKGAEKLDADCFPDENIFSRSEMECVAVSWFEEHSTEEFDETMIRFDVICIVVLGPDRALLRHHRNALGSW